MKAQPKKRDYAPQARGALEGVRVLDLSRLVAGNTLTQVLADFGAEVIKVEPPAGDTLRAWQTSGVPVTWKLYSRSKKSLCLELRRPEGRELLLKLVPSAAVFIESFRPGTLEKMGLAPGALLARNPKLVVVRISGWGQDGPYSQRPGFGTLIEGMSGFASMNGFADREPVLPPMYLRSEEHTSELQSPCNLVCRLLLEKKKKERWSISSHSASSSAGTRRTSPSCS